MLSSNRLRSRLKWEHAVVRESLSASFALLLNAPVPIIQTPKYAKCSPMLTSNAFNVSKNLGANCASLGRAVCMRNAIDLAIRADWEIFDLVYLLLNILDL